MQHKQSNHPDAKTVVDSRNLTAYLGIQLKQLCRSPLPGRNDNTPSFQVFTSNGRQIWKDFGLTGPGSSGNIITLHRLLHSCSFDQACVELMKWDGSSPMVHVSTKPARTPRCAVAVDGIGTVSSTPVEQSMYIRQSGLPVPAWCKEQLGMYVDIKNNLCFKTSNGIHYKGAKSTETGKTFAGNVGSAGFSVCGNTTTGNWMVFEGIGDFLAYVDTLPGFHECYGFLILNSVQMAAQAIEWLKGQEVSEMSLLLDNDQSGDDTTQIFMNEFPSAVDQRDLITHGKDYKETWEVEKFSFFPGRF